MCGENKRAPEEISSDLSDFVGDFGLCTQVPISDRFVLTAAHCIEEFV